MSVRTMRAAWVVFLITVLAGVVACYLLYRYALTYPDRPLAQAGGKIKVEIPRGTAFPGVVAILERRGMIHRGAPFRIFANYKGVANKVRAGTYDLDPGLTPRKLLEVLVHGVPAPTVKVTIPEGKHMLEVAAILEGAKISTAKALLKSMRDRRLLRRLGLPGHTAEGYLFPDTYKLKAPTPAAEVVEKLVRRHRAVYFALRKKHIKGYTNLKKSMRWGQQEIVTMASIVEKETGQSSERPLIAGVFLNRLLFRSFQPKLLQTDPTIVYGCTVPEVKSRACRKFKGRIRRIHLDDPDNPYNTYTHSKLPPGPIANPGRAALAAVLNPTKSRYLYFVSKNDGTHYFSKTVAEHDRAVDKYQRGK